MEAHCKVSTHYFLLSSPSSLLSPFFSLLPTLVFFVDQNCLRRFRERFRHPYKELVERLLKEPHAINVEEAYNPGFPPTHNEECHCGGMTSNAA